MISNRNEIDTGKWFQTELMALTLEISLISNRNEITFFSSAKNLPSVLGKFRGGRGRAEHARRQRVHRFQRVYRFFGVSQ